MKHLILTGYIAFLGIHFLLSNEALAQDLTIDKQYILEKKQRITRMEYDFSYRVKIINEGSAIKDVKASVSSTSTNTTVIDGSVNFSDVSANASSESIDTFTIRQNRRHAFDPNSLVWSVQYELVNNRNLPPDPGEKGLLTIQGIDSDNDGVRDDVQISIANRYPNNTNARLALRQLAKSLQRAFIAQISNNTQQINETVSSMDSAAKCIAASSNNASVDILLIENIMANTNDRGAILIDVFAAAAGKFFVVDIDDLESNCER